MFELQLMPKLTMVFRETGVATEGAWSADWGTVLVFSCVADCFQGVEELMEEVVIVQSE